MVEDEIPPVILVVEDDAVLRAVYERVLRDAKMSPRLAEDGSAALAVIKREIPDAVICDMAMPGASGLTVINEIRNRPQTKDVPIIVVSALPRNSEILSGVTADWDLYLQKPTSMEELIEKVTALIAKRRKSKG